jgi:putative MFS transporter
VATLALLNFLTLIFIGAENSTVPPYLSELWPARIRGKLVGWMMAFFGLGIALAPVWALLVIPNLGWRWAFLLTAPFALIGGAIRSKLPESPRWLVNTGNVAQAESVLQCIEAEVEKAVGTSLPPPIAYVQPGQVYARSRLRPRDLLGPAYRRTTLMLWCLWFAEYGVLYAFQTFLPTMLSSEGHSIVKSFRYSVVIYGAVIPGYVLGGQIVEWLDRKYSILLSFAAIGAFGTLFGWSKSSLGILVFGGLTAFFLALGSTAIYTYTPELYPTEVRATGMGVASAWGRGGAIVLLLAFGFLFAKKDKLSLFIASDCALLIASIAVASSGPSTRGRRLEEIPRTIIAFPAMSRQEDQGNLP